MSRAAVLLLLAAAIGAGESAGWWPPFVPREAPVPPAPAVAPGMMAPGSTGEKSGQSLPRTILARLSCIMPRSRRSRGPAVSATGTARASCHRRRSESLVAA
jgi:hypothetical protein